VREKRRQDDRLDSWKAIAAYLGRDVRTATRWELSRGLPIRRLPGSTRSAVYAYKYEIDAWLSNIAMGQTTTVERRPDVSPVADADQMSDADSIQLSELMSDVQHNSAMDLEPDSRQIDEVELTSKMPAPQPVVPTLSADLLVTDAHMPAAWMRRNLKQIGVGVLAMCMLGFAIHLYAGARRPQPTRLIFTRDSLEAWDDQNRLLWQHRFDQDLVTTAAARDPIPGSLQRLANEEVNRASFHDLDGDGKVEILATTLFPSGNPGTFEYREVVWCFETDGRVRWRFEP
jgi:hypothetical protein